ncbi:hypothetical protein BDP81DRAFT_66947 [Colletotrichum phormii]|uniref:Uncharacterized protein n=1 Tax=Colletotrichum phormii TaxID=359342 RepID=A0AAI9ZKR9_9PEZI|nr:uncharacterized protein BDP81DRAFT_66947 [Colletotrichum phormii]KAK1633486.1 hypothetical protein BDP81DRAFT_66947 [Colletotrichum phormii]
MSSIGFRDVYVKRFRWPTKSWVHLCQCRCWYTRQQGPCGPVRSSIILVLNCVYLCKEEVGGRSPRFLRWV